MFDDWLCLMIGCVGWLVVLNDWMCWMIVCVG